eukprot:TRINITY_DN3973_c0_g1_i1.p1 TRINITY_DN3973_c0_g1~~TRINITY_DN3973_c0_g1_i1.p1  ORF type:complete len:139 (+),score=31.13 TRINITY_DN3973_c0_g1_i1:54-470(+)
MATKSGHVVICEGKNLLAFINGSRIDMFTTENVEQQESSKKFVFSINLASDSVIELKEGNQVHVVDDRKKSFILKVDNDTQTLVDGFIAARSKVDKLQTLRSPRPSDSYDPDLPKQPLSDNSTTKTNAPDKLAPENEI